MSKKISLLTILLSAYFYTFSQNVAMNTTGNAAEVSAMLDIVAADKGMLLPRVSLSSNTDATTVTGTEANSLIVFNTNGSMTNGSGIGYYYWDLPTLKWIYLTAASNGPGSIRQVLTSQGSGNNPQWSNPTATGGGGGTTGCAACITAIITHTTSVTWSQCRDYCRTLTESTYSDWRIPTFEEAVCFLSGTFDSPTSWTNDHIWTSTPTIYMSGAFSPNFVGTAVDGRSNWMMIQETTGQWDEETYNQNSRDCRCVR